MKCSFVKLAEEILPEGRNFFRSKSEKELKTWKKKLKIFSVEVFLWTQRIQTWQTHRKIFDKTPNFFAQCQKKIRKAYDFRQKISFKLFLWTRRMQLWQPRCKFFDNSRNFSAQCPQIIKKSDSFFVENICFLKVLLKTGRKPFRQLHQKNINRKIFRSMSKVDQFFFQNNSCRQNVHSLLRMQFSQTFRKKRPKGRKILLSMSKNENFSSKCSFGHVECSFQYTAEKFSPKGPFFSLNVLKYLNISFFQKEFLSSKCWAGLLESSFDKPVEKFPTKAEIFSLKVQKQI